MQPRDFDFAVIGGGSAGFAAARTAASRGLRAIVIEGGPEVGGLCILRGCMPSKTLIESANRLEGLRRASEYGLKTGAVGYDPVAIIERKRRLIANFAGYRREQLETAKFEFLRASARFTGAHTLLLTLPDGSERSLTASYFLVATGSEISFPGNIPGLREAEPLTSDDILDSPVIPKSIVVLGAGPVALELAHYLDALGSDVTIIQRGPQLLTGVDPDLARVVEETFRERCQAVHVGTHLVRLERHGDRRRVVFQQDGVEKTVEADAIFNALGRRPRTAGLGLETIGVKLDRGRVSVGPDLRTSVPHIFAAGDCAGPYEIVHLAVEQGELSARNIAALHEGRDQLEAMDYRLKLYVVFTDPEVAAVGLSEEEARAEGLDFHTATYPFDDHGKSMVMGETKGFVKLLALAGSGEIIGGSVVGPHAADLIHEIVVAMAFRSTAAQLAKIPHYHPTLSEIWTYPAEELAG